MKENENTTDGEGIEASSHGCQIAFAFAELQPPAPIFLPFLSRFLYWAILLTPLLQIIGIAYGWRNWRNKGVGHILLTVIPYGAVALLWLFVVPPLITSPIWPGIWFFFPELAYGLIAGAALGISWSVIYTGLYLRGRRSK